jgi:pilus assembly protein Flp/PilA
MLKLFVSAVTFLTAPLRQDDRGATAVEYGLIVALIAAVIVVVVGLLGGQVATAFSTVYNNM